MAGDPDPYLITLYRRVLQRQDPALAQVSFGVAVLERYRAVAGYSLIRTDSAGRLKREGGWSIDFGISDGDRLVHASVQDLMHALPEEERDHWAQHVVALPMSSRFLQMRLTPGSCFDDGDVRSWD